MNEDLQAQVNELNHHVDQLSQQLQTSQELHEVTSEKYSFADKQAKQSLQNLQETDKLLQEKEATFKSVKQQLEQQNQDLTMQVNSFIMSKFLNA